MDRVEHTAQTGVVLAAGYGSRLSEFKNGPVPTGSGNDMAVNGDDNYLKPLTEVAGIPLIYRTLDSLEKAGLQKVHIVVGYKGDLLEEAVRKDYAGNLTLNFIENQDYDLNNGVSVLKAQQYVDEPFILTMADHVLGDDLVHLAGNHYPPAHGATLLVDYKVESIFDIDDATKVLASKNILKDIGKQIPNYNCIDTGVFVATPALFTHLENVYQEKGDASLSEGIEALAGDGRMQVLDIKDAFWQDVDTPEMLKYAEWVLNKKSFVKRHFKESKVR